MGKIFGKILFKRYFFFIFLALALVGLLIPNSYGQEDLKTRWGFSFGGGIKQHARHDFTMWTFLPRVDIPLHRNWDFEVEGNFSYYVRKMIKDLYVLGLDANLLYKPIQWKKGSIFILGGVGLGYNNNNDHNKRTWDIGDTHVNGILQAGAGMTYYIGKGVWLRGEYRFHHISDPFINDPGINSHDFMLGVLFGK
jgi:opacity protein-like surface antigen